jgi:hypothetical protein
LSYSVGILARKANSVSVHDNDILFLMFISCPSTKGQQEDEVQGIHVFFFFFLTLELW